MADPDLSMPGENRTVAVPVETAIAYIKAQATSAATATATVRLNHTIAVLVLLITVLALVVAGFGVFYTRHAVDARVEAVANRITLEPALILTAIKTQLIEPDIYVDSEADDLIAALGDLQPAIANLTGTSRKAALVLIEQTIDALLDKADFSRAHKLYAVFGDDLLENDGIVQSMAIMRSVELVLGWPDVGMVTDLDDTILALSLDPDKMGIERQRVLNLIVNGFYGARIWDWDRITTYVLQETRRDEAFLDALEFVTASLTDMADEGDPRVTRSALEVLDRLDDALAMAGNSPT